MLDRLDRAAARQRGFVEDAAHELRSPISSLRAAVEVAEAHPAAFTSGELAAELAPEVRRMQALVDDSAAAGAGGRDGVAARRR